MLVAAGEKGDMTHVVNFITTKKQTNKNAGILSVETHLSAWVLNNIKNFLTLLGDVFLLLCLVFVSD